MFGLYFIIKHEQGGYLKIKLNLLRDVNSKCNRLKEDLNLVFSLKSTTTTYTINNLRNNAIPLAINGLSKNVV
jgi:hypothetical protein